ncbi:type VI secretion system lipoprotein TssJ [Herbaspirillum sp. RTI4]|uniref:type VI secretion system lipoprotein TssJ n=1 Tax=Herbaspirillum sp. RTI4 TaxID=3048640 RepID=UPI002AB5CEF6|nr:type VI secretion system lipoprotein TssJ [Herbaspirillum sp. RTI4]MDY7579033.1 type VI secretion system lipoprotein TssJ [Herbaspirillum sp. RTI4]MEA9982382.1 type VI secretion system lipoprotein TssJ [Herbaspirillum sp. RTI4]
MQFPLHIIFLCMLIISLNGCTFSALGSAAGSVLQMAGIAKSDIPDAQKSPRTIHIKLQARKNLNSDSNGTPFALVVRIYKLRQEGPFLQAAYEIFTMHSKEKDALGADLIEVKEVTLVPGQDYEIQEKVSRDANFIGVVALYRAPVPEQWKLSVPIDIAEKKGIYINAHACALSVDGGVIPAAKKIGRQNIGRACQ